MKFLSFPALAQVGALLAVTAAGKPGTVTTPSVCTLTGTYKNGTDLSSCSNIVINSLSVPAGVTLDLSNLKDGASITFQGTTTFGTQNWRGPLVQLTGKHLKVGGSGVLDGQGSWYWPQGQNATKPKFFFVTNVSDSHLSDFRIQNMPVHTFYIMGSQRTVLERITIDSRLGDGVAKNTDGFGLNTSDHITIQNCHVNNQDDCLAMQSSTNTFFLNNYCSGGHGISIGSLGGAQADWTDTVDGLLVANNRIVNNTNGIRIKTLVDKFGAVTNIKYINNTLENVDNAIVVHSDYSKTAGVNAKGGYTGNATSHVTISNITIKGLSGTATNLYDIFVNPAVSSNWQFSGIAVTAKSVGSCLNQPSNIKCT